MMYGKMFGDNDLNIKSLLAVLEGKKVHYDACSSQPLSEAKKYYNDRYKYIGSNKGVIYLDGVRNDFKEETHYFKLKLTKKQKRELCILNDFYGCIFRRR